MKVNIKHPLFSIQLDDWGMTMEEVNSGQNLRPGIDYDPIVDADYPRYVERPIIYERKPVEIFETSPPPKEIASAISLLKDYMIEGDAAIEKHKQKVRATFIKIFWMNFESLHPTITLIGINKK